nr:PepSY domain-containing protein [Acetobacter tropicalis]
MPRLPKLALRTLYLTHRWTGICMGLLMVSWCASGIVMLWHGWPQPDEKAQQAVYAPLHLPDTLPDIPSLSAPNAQFRGFRLASIGDEPVLTLYPAKGSSFAVDLRTGHTGTITPEDASASARRYAQATGTYQEPVFDGTTTDDQWVLDTHGRQDGFHRYRFEDVSRTYLYVSRLTGDVVQATTAASRRWAWVGAIPHWLYPALLRRHPSLWQQVVIVFSGIGVFLTITGLLVGVLRLRRKWPFSYYRRWHLVHHLGGTVFGLLALSWITTGLLTMNPAGLFESEQALLYPQRVSGAVNGRTIQTLLQKLITTPPSAWTQVQGVVLADKVSLRVEKRDGQSERLSAQLQPERLTPDMLEKALHQSHVLSPQSHLSLITRPDAYYFNHATHIRTFPVLKGTAPDGTLLYLNAQTGELVAAFDTPAKQSRWIVYGLHDLDLWEWLRKPVARWTIVFPLLCGVLLIYLSGVIIAAKRLKWKMGRRTSSSGQKNLIKS